ncbi:PaaI family thioesterase [Nocardia sp. NPDC051750]|uniref:PaaI family thioesterase n=1 Tax=Nocardia sp. NPDC051750 TaxID=3364325 RepID=UPI0037A95D01
MDLARVFTQMSARQFAAFTSLYPPFLLGGVRVVHVADDWTSVTVRLKVRGWNKNHNGAAFGGMLSAMTDPFFGLMAQWQLGDEYTIWNTRVSTEFLAPGRGEVRATMCVSPDEAEVIRRNVAATGSSRTIHSADLVGSDGRVVARHEQEVYARLRT